MIEWIKCEKCGLLQHPTHLRCLKCKNQKFSSIKAEGVAKLLTYTVLTAPPAEFRNKKSYALGIVEFENGIKALGQIATSQGLKIGMQVNPIYEKVCDNLDGEEVYNYVFYPIE